MDDNIDYSIDDDKGKCVLAFYEDSVINEDEIPEELKSGTQSFYYTGSPQEFVVPNGVKELKLEVWGASGAILGGNGGYSSGIMIVTTEKILHVYVGGVGRGDGGLTLCSYSNSNFGGWNGGGNGTGGFGIGGGGGGATDVRTRGGEWNDENSIKTKLIVAGGGGGGEKNTISSGGIGGGYNSACTDGQDGARSGGACGINSNGIGGQGGCYNGGGGGGGYYGGCTGSPLENGSSGGGSGYIGGVTNGGGSNGVRSGHGIARICWGNEIDVCGNNNQFE
jgi:hypothetical protein